MILQPNQSHTGYPPPSKDG
jgi:chromosome segregation ATPase